MPDDIEDVDTVVLARLLEHLVPSGDGAGAAELGLLAFVLARLEGARAADVPTFAAGLADLDLRTRARHGHHFAVASDVERDGVLADLERDEAGLPPWARGAAFLETMLRYVREGMFGDPLYGGNREGRGWDLLGYPDPRRTWTAVDQRVDVVILPREPRSAQPPAVAAR